MERLGLSSEEMYELSKGIWKTNEEEIAKSLGKSLSEPNTQADILRILIKEMSVKFIPLVLVHVMEANNTKITSQIQELLKK